MKIVKKFKRHFYSHEKSLYFAWACFCNVFNPLVTNGLSHPNNLDEPIVIFRGTRCIFSFLIFFFDENPVNKQSSPRWEAAFCGAISGAFLFVYDT